ncbi:hypothetical protein N752_24450 [Desulforamulus aquiferis]|nr:ATP-binding protein [Desulforamulus aquiferis]RYD02483.1 hypothetical protein N752_24450 [Desulforamulus aquiferis]
MNFKLKFNPFTNQPLSNPNIFAGREQEIFYMIKSLFQTAKGNPKHVFVTGERGIGKSSYAKQIELIATGDRTLIDRIGIDTDRHVFEFISSKHTCTEGNSLEQIVNSLLETLKEKVSRIPKFNVKELDISFEINLGIIKAGINPKGQIEQVPSELINAFVSVLKQLSDKVMYVSEGLVLIIDELDKVVNTANFGSFFKALTERLIDKNVMNVSIVLVGINGTMQKLTEQHESVRRIFHEIEIPILNMEERKLIVTNALNEVKATVDIEVLNEIAHISGGFPAPIHLLGESIYDCDTDNHLDINDFRIGLDKVIRYIKKSELKDKLKGAGSGRYQQILRIMASYPQENVPLSHISQELGVDHPRQYSTNIRKLLDNDFIEKVELGIYKLKDKLLRTYILNVAMLEDDDEMGYDEDSDTNIIH